ncbi:solute carrier family 25 member 48 isoform 2-T2 [Hipposideros larvatus]
MGTDLAPGGRSPAAPAMGSFQLEDFVAGWIGGAASVIIGYPLDTVKTRLQAGVGYGNTLSCIRMVYRKESVFGFFKGMSFPLASIAVYNSVVFGVFSNTQRFLSQQQCREPRAGTPHSLSDLLLASMVAGVVSVGLGTPVDLIKIRLQMQTQPFREANLGLKPRAAALGERSAYQGPVHCIATIVRTEGLAGLYRGGSAMLLRDVPGYCLYFIPYVLLNDWITPEGCAGPSPCAVWLAGGMAGVFQRHHCECGAGLPHECGHVPWVRALTAGDPTEPRRDQPLSARLLLTAMSLEPTDLRVPSFSIVSTLFLTSRLESLSCHLGGTTDRSPSGSDLHWHLGKSGIKPTLSPRPPSAHWEITKELQLSLKFPNKNIENIFRSFLYQMLLPGFQETPAALILPSVQTPVDITGPERSPRHASEKRNERWQCHFLFPSCEPGGQGGHRG